MYPEDVFVSMSYQVRLEGDSLTLSTHHFLYVLLKVTNKYLAPCRSEHI